jgi:hypothetical protein
MRIAVAKVAALMLGLVVSSGLGWAADDPPFDHRGFDRLLRQHVHGDLVDYAAFAGTPDLKSYLDGLATVDLAPLPETERLALWINAYNAYTIRIVVDHGTPESIRDIEAPNREEVPGNAWQTPIVAVGGRRFREPRIHFALICAARGCPPLRAEAYTGDRLEAQLDDQAMRFLHGKAKGCRIDASQGTVYVSEIFEWYREDFGDDDDAIGRYIARYLPDSLEKQVLESGRFRLLTLPFDWRLNGVDAGP